MPQRCARIAHLAGVTAAGLLLCAPPVVAQAAPDPTPDAPSPSAAATSTISASPPAAPPTDEAAPTTEPTPTPAPTTVTVDPMPTPIRRNTVVTLHGRAQAPAGRSIEGAGVHVTEQDSEEALAFGHVESDGTFTITWQVPTDAAASTQPNWPLRVHLWPDETLATSTAELTLTFADQPRTRATAVPTTRPTSADRGYTPTPVPVVGTRQIGTQLSPVRDILALYDPWASAFLGSALFTLVGATMLAHGRRQTSRD